MRKYSEKEINCTRDWAINKLFGIKSIFGIVYRDMIAHKQEPFGKDINILFDKAEKICNATTKNKKIKSLYKDITNYHMEE